MSSDDQNSLDSDATTEILVDTLAVAWMAAHICSVKIWCGAEKVQFHVHLTWEFFIDSVFLLPFFLVYGWKKVWLGNMCTSVCERARKKGCSWFTAPKLYDAQFNGFHFANWLRELFFSFVSFSISIVGRATTTT